MKFFPRASMAMSLASLLALGACDAGQTDPTDQEPEIATMVMEVNQGVEFTATSSGFSLQTLVLDNIGFTISSAEFLRADGNPETVINLEDFRLAVAGDADGGPLPEGVVFTRSGPFSGSVSGIQEGQSLQVFISLYHIEPEHEDFGPVALTVSRPEGDGGGGGENP
jgi:hypothetical protein